LVDHILVDRCKPQNIYGIIDFGDLVRSPLIIDLAVACTYCLKSGGNPFEGALPMIAGYNAISS